MKLTHSIDIQKPPSHELGSLSEQVSERMSATQRVSEVSSAELSKRMSEWCEQISKRMSEWPSALRVNFTVIQPIVQGGRVTSSFII